jgi:hypothetical protein
LDGRRLLLKIPFDFLDVLEVEIVRKEWYSSIDAYKRWLDEGVDIEPLLSLSEILANSDLATRLFPFTSHFDLCISTTGNYIERELEPIITISYRPTDQFIIRFSQKAKDTYELAKTTCSTSEILHFLTPLLETLNSRINGKT